jgi:hypothetical protein
MMTRYYDVMSDDTALFDECIVSSLITSKNRVTHQTESHVVAHYSKVSCHHIKQCRVVAHYIIVSCHHIKQSVVSSLITSTYRVITYDTILWCNERRHGTVWCVTRFFDGIVSSHQTKCCVVAHYINVSCHHIKQNVVSSLITSTCRVITSTRVLCRRSLHQSIILMWWHDTLM